MKITIKPIYLIAFWVFSLAIVFFLCKRFTKVPKQLKIEVPYEKPVYYKDPNGVTHERFQQVVTQKELLEKQLDSISKVLNVKLKEIDAQDNISTVTEINYTAKPIFNAKDSSFNIEKKDSGYLDLVVSGNSNSFNVQVHLIDTITRTQYTVNHLFGPSETFIDLQNRNKYVRINNGNSFSIRQTKPVLTIGPTVGYDPIQKNFFIGISVQFPIITIRK